MSAPAPNFSAKRLSSPRAAGRSFRSTKCTATPRSLKKRCALRVSWQSVNPKTWAWRVVMGAGSTRPAHRAGGLRATQAGSVILARRSRVRAGRPDAGRLRRGGRGSRSRRWRRVRAARTSRGTPSSAPSSARDSTSRCRATRPRPARGSARPGSRAPDGPAPARRALRAEELLEPRRLPVRAVSEDVDLGAGDVAVDLEAGDDLERRELPRFVHRFVKAVGGVVVGHGEDAHSVPRREAYEVAGRERPVGRGRVRVQIDRAAHRYSPR